MRYSCNAQHQIRDASTNRKLTGINEMDNKRNYFEEEETYSSKLCLLTWKTKWKMMRTCKMNYYNSFKSGINKFSVILDDHDRYYQYKWMIKLIFLKFSSWSRQKKKKRKEIKINKQKQPSQSNQTDKIIVFLVPIRKTLYRITYIVGDSWFDDRMNVKLTVTKQC